MSFSSWLRKHRCIANSVERPCIGCLEPFRTWGVTFIPLPEQFCSKRCKTSFYHGYDLGLRASGMVSRWPKMGGH